MTYGAMFTIYVEVCVAEHLIPEADTCVLTESCLLQTIADLISLAALPTHCVISYTNDDDCWQCRTDEEWIACVGSYRKYHAEED